MKEVVDIEIEFITLAIPCRIIGMNSTLMIVIRSFRSMVRINYICQLIHVRN